MSYVRIGLLGIYLAVSMMFALSIISKSEQVRRGIEITVKHNYLNKIK